MTVRIGAYKDKSNNTCPNSFIWGRETLQFINIKVRVRSGIKMTIKSTCRKTYPIGSLIGIDNKKLIFFYHIHILSLALGSNLKYLPDGCRHLRFAIWLNCGDHHWFPIRTNCNRDVWIIFDGESGFLAWVRWFGLKKKHKQWSGKKREVWGGTSYIHELKS